MTSDVPSAGLETLRARDLRDLAGGVVEALSRSFAVVEFGADGTVLAANENFLDAVLYAREEVVGRHHRMFVAPEFAESPAYDRFWAALRAGERVEDDYKYIAKGGLEVYLRAAFDPVLDETGEVVKVVQCARDTTAEKLEQVVHQGQVEAIGATQAVAEYDLDGTIRTANENYLAITGHALGEVVGQKHRMFLPRADASAPAEDEFWRALSRGELQAGEYRRVAKSGVEVFLQGSYHPIADMDGQPFKVVQFARDITRERRERANLLGQVEAIGRSQAVIEFELDGTILTANANFLAATGYRLDEIVGRHHRIFVDPVEAASPDYTAFWAALARGEFRAGEFKRFAKDGSEVFIRATYNPILDADGRPFKIVKYASDVTAEKRRSLEYEGQIEAINKSQAVIEFDLDGTIRTANANFLAATGYSLEEIVGRHHRMFVTPEHARSDEYRELWRILGSGTFHAGEYHRVKKDGSDIFIQASYNPIFDANGRPYKVVKYASDVTATVLARQSVAEMAKTLGSAAAELREVSEAMTASVHRNAERTQSASAASDSVNAHAQSLASATEEMSTCINEIARNTSEAARFGADASKAANATNATVEKLGASSAEIGVFTKVITSIAEQTNLLALNATIEAARAGEAGRGFAVVASEVKELARETAKATADITKKVAAIQDDTGQSVEEIARIAKIIDDLNGIQTSIAGAIEEQTNTTTEMSRSVAEASSGMGSVASSLGDLADSATDLENGAAAAESAAERLAAMAADLQALIESF